MPKKQKPWHEFAAEMLEGIHIGKLTYPYIPSHYARITVILCIANTEIPKQGRKKLIKAIIRFADNNTEPGVYKLCKKALLNLGCPKEEAKELLS